MAVPFNAHHETPSAAIANNTASFSAGNFGDFVVGAPHPTLLGAIVPAVIAGALAWIAVAMIKSSR